MDQVWKPCRKYGVQTKSVYGPSYFCFQMRKEKILSCLSLILQIQNLISIHFTGNLYYETLAMDLCRDPASWHCFGSRHRPIEAA
jgi:hypothetical protein